MTPTPRTCSTCRRFQRDSGPVSTCEIGGPAPSEGCSDTHESETCARWLTDSEWTPDESPEGVEFNRRIPF